MSKRKAAHCPNIVLLLLIAAWVAVPAAEETRRQQAATTPTDTGQAAGRTTGSGQPTSKLGGGAQTQEPPVMTFAPEGLSLEDAVRVTLQNDPDIKLQTEAVRFQEGVVQEQAGHFDPAILGTVAYDYRKTDLSSDAISAQQSVRDSLSSSIPFIQSSTTTAQTTINLLEQARNGPLSSDSLAALTQAAPSVAGTLANFDAILAGLTGTARTTLAAARTQFIAATESSLKQAQVQGQQDLLAAQQQLKDLGTVPTQQTSHDFNFNFQVAKPFRNGLVATPFFSGDVQGSNFSGKPSSAEFGGSGLEDVYTFQAGLNLLVPLARGRGARAADAFERASASERAASQLTLQHQSTASALRTILAYWNLRAAQESVDVVNRSVELQTRLVALTQGLIAAGELPQTELARGQAAEARARAQLFDSERVWHQARLALATAMGVAATGDDTTLPRTRDAFPEPPPDVEVQTSSTYLSEATSLRSDLSAASNHAQAGTMLVENAETNLRPRLDLNSSTFFTSLGQGGIGQSIDRWVGPSETASLQIEKPVGNNLFAGQLGQRRADLAQRRIALTDLTRQVRLNVLQATGSLQDTVEAVRQAEAAVRLYQTTIDAEIQRFQIGEATLIDTVQTEQQQTDALLGLVSARLALAQLIAQLRFETGTLLQDGVVTGRNLIAVPGPLGRRP